MHRITSFHVIHFMLENHCNSQRSSLRIFEREESSLKMLVGNDDKTSISWHTEWKKVRAKKKKRDDEKGISEKLENQQQRVSMVFGKICEKLVCTQKVLCSLGNKVLFHRIKLIKNLTQTNWSTAFNHSSPPRTHYRLISSTILHCCNVTHFYNSSNRKTTAHHIFLVLHHIICRALLIYGLIFLIRSRERGSGKTKDVRPFIQP